MYVWSSMLHMKDGKKVSIWLLFKTDLSVKIKNVNAIQQQTFKMIVHFLNQYYKREKTLKQTYVQHIMQDANYTEQKLRE